jgi:hypothetical protein
MEYAWLDGYCLKILARPVGLSRWRCKQLLGLGVWCPLGMDLLFRSFGVGRKGRDSISRCRTILYKEDRSVSI